MDREIAKAINTLANRLNEVERKLSAFIEEKTAGTDDGLTEIADIVSVHDEMIAELTEAIMNGGESVD